MSYFHDFINKLNQIAQGASDQYNIQNQEKIEKKVTIDNNTAKVEMNVPLEILNKYANLDIEAEAKRMAEPFKPKTPQEEFGGGFVGALKSIASAYTAGGGIDIDYRLGLGNLAKMLRPIAIGAARNREEYKSALDRYNTMMADIKDKLNKNKIDAMEALTKYEAERQKVQMAYEEYKKTQPNVNFEYLLPASMGENEKEALRNVAQNSGLLVNGMVNREEWTNNYETIRKSYEVKSGRLTDLKVKIAELEQLKTKSDSVNKYKIDQKIMTAQSEALKLDEEINKEKNERKHSFDMQENAQVFAMAQYKLKRRDELIDKKTELDANINKTIEGLSRLADTDITDFTKRKALESLFGEGALQGSIDDVKSSLVNNVHVNIMERFSTEIDIAEKNNTYIWPDDILLTASQLVNAYKLAGKIKNKNEEAEFFEKYTKTLMEKAIDRRRYRSYWTTK